MLLSNLISTFFSFYAHNGPVIFYGLGIVFAFLFLIARPKRRYVAALLGFLLLLFSFEYQKHFTAHFNSHLVMQLTDPKLQAEEYGLLSRFFNQLLPIGLDIGGWFLLFLALFL